MDLEHLSRWQISQVLSLTYFEKRTVNSLFQHEKLENPEGQIGKQLSFLDL